jgi:hypothetical protein
MERRSPRRKNRGKIDRGEKILRPMGWRGLRAKFKPRRDIPPQRSAQPAAPPFSLEQDDIILIAPREGASLLALLALVERRR